MTASKRKKYPCCSALVARALGLKSPLGSWPGAIQLAEAICVKKGWREVKNIGKGEAKKMVMDFAEELRGNHSEIKFRDFSVKPQPQPQPQLVIIPIEKRSAPQDFYWSEEWRRVRYIALRASRGVCELCGVAPTPGHPLHIDHIKPRSRYPEMELDPSNLQVLCEDCNLGKSNTDQIDWRRKGA